MNHPIHKFREFIVFNDTKSDPYSIQSLVRRAIILGMSEDAIEIVFSVTSSFIEKMELENEVTINKVMEYISKLRTVESSLVEPQEYYTLFAEDTPINVMSKILGVDSCYLGLINFNEKR